MKKYLSLLVVLLLYTNLHAQYQHDSLKIDDGYLHYYVKGAGQPVVLLQGGPGFSSYYMRGISDSLSNYRSVLIDYQGHGRSQYIKPDTSWATMDNILFDIERIRTHLGIDKWTLIGNSYGSHFALYYAVKYPENTQKVILTASPGTSNEFLKYYSDNIRIRWRDAYSDTLKKMPKETPIDLMKRNQVYFKPYFYDGTNAKKVFQAPQEELLHFYNNEYFIAAVSRSGFENWDVSNEVYDLDIPIRIIQGRQDPVNGTEVQLNERAKNSKLIYIEQAGHFPWAEKPVEFFDALRNSLKD